MWNFWQKKNGFNYILSPISFVFLAGVSFRKWMYRTGIFKKIVIPIPVIVVGNITVGGSGKTSFVLSLAQFLENKGLKIGVISRGYRSQSEREKKIVEVKMDSAVEIVGDEPLLIKKSNPKLVVFVGVNRVKAAQKCLKKTDVDVIISDDGLQHYRLNRNIEIVLNDKNHNSLLLPAGPLREPISRLKEVDFVIESNQYSYQAELWQDCFSKQTLPLTYFSESNQSNIYGYSALAKNKNFKQSVEQLRIKPKKWFFFNDHYAYQAQDFFNLPKNAVILTSFKDSVKFKQKWFQKTQKCFFLKASLLVDKNIMNKILQKLTPLLSQ